MEKIKSAVNHSTYEVIKQVLGDKFESRYLLALFSAGDGLDGGFSFFDSSSQINDQFFAQHPEFNANRMRTFVCNHSAKTISIL